MESQVIQLAEQHKAATEVAALWVVKEVTTYAPIVWKKLVNMYPYCRDNGGVFGIVKSFFEGSKSAIISAPVNKVETQSIQTNETKTPTSTPTQQPGTPATV